MSLIQAENEGLSKQEAIEYAARANNVGTDVVADIYNSLIEWQDKIADKLGIRL